MLIKNRITSPAGLKNEVFILRSVNNIVIAAANTGKLNNSKNDVISNDQINSGNLIQVKPGALILKMVVIKFIAPNNDATPAKCKEKIARSTDGPVACDDNGGYTVHPVPAPIPANMLNINKNNAGGNNQNERLLRRGNAISGHPKKICMKKFPKPPIIAGITIKKIIINACPVIIELYT